MRRRLRLLIREATRCIYSGYSDFAEIVSCIQRSYSGACLDEIHLAICAVLEIEGAFEDAVYAVEKISDKAVVEKAIDNILEELDEVTFAETQEIRRLTKNVIKAKAEHAFSSIKIAFAFADLAADNSFGGLVRRGNKIKKGPISIAQRKRFKVLADGLEEANSTIRWAEKEEKRLLAEQEELKNRLSELEDDEIDDEDDPRLAYPHAFNYHYSIDDDDVALTVADHHTIENAVNRWCDKTNYYCEIERNDRGFKISVWCFSNARESVGTNLFLDLADMAFRTMGKSIRYI